jgi:hypothetical protein
MTQLIPIVAQMATGIALPALLVRWDERRLGDELRDRCWPEASFWCAVVTFGLFSIPVHFCRTRRSVLGLVQGLLWAVATGAAMALAGWMSGPTES